MATKANTDKLIAWAVRNRVRFNFGGNLSVEEVNRLSMNDLKQLFDLESAKISVKGQRTLRSDKSNEDETAEKRLDLLEALYDEKLANAEAAEKRQATIAAKMRAKQALLKKKEAAFDDMSEEELEAFING